jgi:ABC-type glycerol-3-phosphate transport system substrate-binding protein
MNSPKLQEQKKGVAFDVVLMPKGADPKRRHRLVVSGLSVMKTNNADASWEFVKYATAEEGQETFSTMTGRMPNSVDLIQSFWIPNVQKMYGVENGRVFVDAFKESMPDVIGEIGRTKMWTEVVKPTAWDALLAGTATAADVLPKVDAGLQKMLDDFWKTKK